MFSPLHRSTDISPIHKHKAALLIKPQLENSAVVPEPVVPAK